MLFYREVRNQQELSRLLETILTFLPFSFNRLNNFTSWNWTTHSTSSRATLANPPRATQFNTNEDDYAAHAQHGRINGTRNND